VVEKCLRKNPDERYQSMQEVRNALVQAPAKSKAPATAIAVAALLILAAAGVGYRLVKKVRNTPVVSQAVVAPAVAPPVVGQPPAQPTQPASDAPIETPPPPEQVGAPVTTPATRPARAPAAVVLSDGMLIHLILAEDIPNDAAEGTPVHFKVAVAVREDDTDVIRKGAAAIGMIVDGAKKKRIPVLGGKMTFRLDRVDAIDGRKLQIRATPVRNKDGSSKRAVVTGAKDTGGRKPKDVIATAGADYSAYVDGTQSIHLR
jgi:hypothetical protein